MAPDQAKEVPFDLMIELKQKLAPTKGSTISIEELVHRLKHVNVHVSVEECKLLLENFIPQPVDSEHISRKQFSQLFDALDNRLALRVLFEKYSIPILNEMGPVQLRTFFEKEQGKEKSTRYCRQLIGEVSPQHSRLTLHEFYQLLAMDSFGLFNGVHRKPCQDMAKPLTHYFVATSVHIRYPEEEQDQLLNCHPDLREKHSNSPEQAAILAKYRDLLLNGYRCLQVRMVWNESTPGFCIPIIRSRHDQCQVVPLQLELFLDEIKQRAFQDSPFPVILQLESEHFPGKIDKLFQAVHSRLEDSLYRPTGKETKYPIVKCLQKKILVYYTLPTSSQVNVSCLLRDGSNDTQKSVAPTDVHHLFDNASSDLSFWDALSVKCSDAMAHIDKSVVQKEQERDKWPRLTESNLVALHWGSEEQSVDWGKVTVNLIRVGVQCIPLEREHLIARALFRLNGECGYVLKPIYLRKGALYKRNTEDKPLKNELPSRVNKYTVRIICATNLIAIDQLERLDNDMNIRVSMRLIGHEMDSNVSFTTRVCSSDGLVPFWNEQTRFWIRVPDLAFFYFEVKNGDKLIGYHMIPVKAILRGNRHVSLYNQQHKLLENAKLFLHIDYKEISSGWYPADPEPPPEDSNETANNNCT